MWLFTVFSANLGASWRGKSNQFHCLFNEWYSWRSLRFKSADGAEIPQNELKNSMAFDFKYRSFPKNDFVLWNQQNSDSKNQIATMKEFLKKRQIFVLILMELNPKIFDKKAQESISITYFLNYFLSLWLENSRKLLS